MKNYLPIILFLSLLIHFSQAIEFDYCVSDTSVPAGPAGYACKDPDTLTVDDFVYRGFRGEKTTANLFKVNLTLAFLDAYPALNGLGISLARLDLGVGGVVPIHSHRTSEVIIVVKGTIIAGFIDTNDKAFYKKLEVGDVMIFPQSMLHFQVNVGDIPATAFVSLNAANPGLQITSLSLFGGNLPGDIAEKVTLLSHKEVTRMKSIFGTA